MLDSFGHEVLDRAQALELLSGAALGRVVFTDRGMPAVQPVRYRVEAGAVWFGAPADSVLFAAARGTVLAFEADSLSAELSDGWWVTVLGHASQELASAGEIDGERAVRLSLEVVTGRRLAVNG